MTASSDPLTRAKDALRLAFDEDNPMRSIFAHDLESLIATILALETDKAALVEALEIAETLALVMPLKREAQDKLTKARATLAKHGGSNDDR